MQYFSCKHSNQSNHIIGEATMKPQWKSVKRHANVLSNIPNGGKISFEFNHTVNKRIYFNYFNYYVNYVNYLCQLLFLFLIRHVFTFYRVMTVELFFS